jgi:hypothetical protein
MARSLSAGAAEPSAPPPSGHNSKAPLTREEKAALLAHHVAILRLGQAEVEKVRAPFQAAQQALTDRFNAAKIDLGKAYSRKYLTSLLEDVGNRLRNLAAQEEQRFQDRLALGLPVFGVQADLFGDATTDTEKDAISAEADGYLAGRRGDEPKVPADFSIFNAEWMAGYHKGQAANAPLQSKAKEVLDARRAPPAKPAEPEDEEETVRKTARKLKNDPKFMDRSAPAERIEPEGEGVEAPVDAPAAAAA